MAVVRGRTSFSEKDPNLRRRAGHRHEHNPEMFWGEQGEIDFGLHAVRGVQGNK